MAQPQAIHELPYELALEILTRQEGYSQESAEEILAIARGESDGDVIETGPSDKGKRIMKRRK